MSTEAIRSSFSAPAAADLSAKQYYAITLDSSAKANLATAAKNMDGVLQNKPVSGQAAEVTRDGITKVAITASTAITNGTLLEIDTGGTFKTLASGTAVAKALEGLSSTAAVCLITAELLRSNAAFS